MSEGPSFHQTTTGGSPQVNQGVTINDPTNITNNGSTPTISEVFEPLKEELKDKTWADHPEPDTVPDEVKEEFETPLLAVSHMESLAEVHEENAAMDEKDGTSLTQQAFEEEKSTLTEKIKWALPMVGKAALIAVKAAAATYVKTSPSVAATLAVTDLLLGDT